MTLNFWETVHGKLYDYEYFSKAQSWRRRIPSISGDSSPINRYLMTHYYHVFKYIFF